MQKTIRTLFILLTATFLWIVCAASLFLTAESKLLLSEKRKGSSRPALPQTVDALKKYPKNYEDWLNDSFFLRDQLTSVYEKILKDVFNQTPWHRQMLAGKEGWTFLNDGYADAISQYIGKLPVEPELYKNWAKQFKSIQDKMANNNVLLLFLIAPEQHTIYPEYLPTWVYKNRKKKDTDYCQDAFHSEGVNLLFPKNTIVEEKQKSLQYFKNDSHWNMIGAYNAYRYIMGELSNLLDSELEVLPLTHQKVTDYQQIMTPLYGQIEPIKNYLKPEQLPNIQLQDAHYIAYHEWYRKKQTASSQKPFLVNLNITRKRTLFVENSNPLNDMNILIIGDSYSDAISVYLGASFSKTVRISWLKYEKIESLMNLVAYHDIDILIFESAERELIARLKLASKNNLGLVKTSK